MAGKSDITRFAPSPTGYLHLGHAYSALFAYHLAMKSGGTFLLRIEDIDGTRCHPQFHDAIPEDLSWLGLHWKTPVRVQSEHMTEYAAALEKLRNRRLLYPCFCTRKDLQQDALQSANAPHATDQQMIYPGTCRHLSESERADRLATTPQVAWRLDCAAAIKGTGALTWLDRRKGMITAQPEMFGDVVLARKDCSASYHLCVTMDDALQGITLVTRGEDLFTSTHIHRLLQALLGLPTPEYEHHPLLLDQNGRRFAKRDQSVTLRALRAEGHTPDTVQQLIKQCATT